MKRLFAIYRKKTRFIIGLMSGTSHDGVDAAIVRIDGRRERSRIRLIHWQHFPYPSALRARIAAAYHGSTAEVCGLNYEIGDFFGRAAVAAIENSGIRRSLFDAVASHGQTVFHMPPQKNSRGATLQIGEPAVIAEKTGLPVISDFRAADMARKGHGAPLVPYADYLLFGEKGKTRAVQNIGGIANVTVVTPEVEDLIAFDTGPGNCLIDAAMLRLFRKPFDRKGSTARRGRADEGLLAELLSHPYFEMRPPKSTGREVFGEELLKRMLSGKRIRPEDLITTLTWFTALSIRNAYDRFILGRYRVDEMIVSGGGWKNIFLMEILKRLFEPLPINSSDMYGIPSAAKEALSFAVLANETLSGNPSNLTGVTGSTGRAVLGKISLP